MIKFFRNIRQNLLSKGKTGKYLTYAFGEIILVVIGILIALSINNWNQKRVQKKESDRILLTLKAEIKEGTTEIEKTIEFLKQRVDKRFEYLNHHQQHITDAEKIKKISNMIFFYTENIELPILESELGPNKKVFQWPELTKSMQKLSESIEYFNKGIEYLENDMYSNILPYSAKEGVIIDLMVSYGMLNSKSYLNADVYNSESFRNVIANSTLMTFSLLEAGKKVLKSYEDLLLMINKKVP